MHSHRPAPPHFEPFAAAHKLKSAARAVGAMALGELSDRLAQAGGADGQQARLVLHDALARQLGIEVEVVAEGVEDRADWDLLRRSGCDIAQGYFMAHPMPGSELAGWLASWTTRLRDEALAEHLDA